MLMDPHIHSSALSRCSRLPYRQMMDETAADQVDGIVLTNHLKRHYIGEEPYRDWAARYVQEFRDAKAYGETIGLAVLFGVEVTLTEQPVVDYLIYGIDEEQFLDSPILYALTQKELYDYCVRRNALLIQAHPYRNGAVPQNPAYLHGVEINCHPLYKTNEEKRVTAFARRHKLLLTCGSDYHGDTEKPHCGVLLPEPVADSKAFAQQLRSGNYTLLIQALENDQEPPAPGTTV